MLTFAFILGMLSAMIELTIAYKIPAIRRLAANNAIANIALSFLISFTIGFIFGANGLIAMTGAIISLMIGMVGYRVLSFFLDSPRIQEIKIVAADTVNVSVKTAKVLTSPIRGIRKIKQLKIRK